MATTTNFLGLKKPATTDNININDINGNMDKIDAEAALRNQQMVWSTSGMALSDFIEDCETRMGSKKGLSHLGYVNAAVTSGWGLDFNGYVLGLYNTESFKAILIFSSQVNRIGKIVKVSGTWDTTIHQVMENRYVAGQTVTNLAFDGYGFLTSGAQRITMCFPMSRVMTVNPTILSGSRFEVRGITGYIGEFTAGNNVELVGNQDYTVYCNRRNNGIVLEVNIQKVSGNFGVTNNTPLAVGCSSLNLQF